MSGRPVRRLDCDLLRVLCMAAVVYLHTAAKALRNSSGLVWHWANAVSSLATAAVPLFFMLSGALLLSEDRTASLSHLFRRRLPRLLVPLLAWSGVVIAAVWVQEGAEAALSIAAALPSTPAVVPYWFVYALLPLYLLSPLLKKMADGLSDSHWNYVVGLWLLLTIGLNTLHGFLPFGSVLRTLTGVHPTLNINAVGGYLGYFLLGARLSRLEKLPPRPLLWGTAAGLWALIALGTWRLFADTGSYDERFKSYLYLFAALLASALFLLLRSYAGEHASPRWLTGLSGLSFGVYLTHPLALSFWTLVWGEAFPQTMTILPHHLLLYGTVLLSCLLGVFLAGSIKPLCFLLTGQRFSAACRESNLFALKKRTGRRELRHKKHGKAP